MEQPSRAALQAAPSYVHGAVDTPLLGETLGQSFARTVGRWGDRPALVVRSHGVRWTLRELRGSLAGAQRLLCMTD